VRPAVRLAVASLAAAAAVATGCARSPSSLHLSTTTSVENSGLLGAILPAFKAETGIEVLAVAVGSGRALAILERGDSDVALTHDPDAESALMSRGAVARYRKVMHNDFVIAGPPADPARLRGGTDSHEAMRRIVASGSPFASRADSSGTHARELKLWRDAGTKPAGAKLIETGAGMAATLRIASERQAYVLTDRATFLQVQHTLRLAILHEGDPPLINTYAVMTRAGLDGTRLANAERLFNWLTDGPGRDLISRYQVGGRPAFIVWPAAAPRDRPEDLPNAR
jgi:tungstate transport system substrate-binding protein